jgi:F420-non-reducing hydrogenase iron-sulfur subunit
MANRTLFLCDRSGRILDDADAALLGEGLRITVPCGGRVEVQHLLKAVEHGAREVLIVACPLDNCRSQLGTEEAERRVEAANRLLAETGSTARCRLVRAAANAPEDLRSHLAASTDASHGEETAR